MWKCGAIAKAASTVKIPRRSRKGLIITLSVVGAIVVMSAVIVLTYCIFFQKAISNNNETSQNDIYDELLDNYWYEYQPAIDAYYVYDFKKNGTYTCKCLSTYSLDEFDCNYSYILDDDVLTLIEKHESGIKSEKEYTYSSEQKLFEYEINIVNEDNPYYGMDGEIVKLFPCSMEYRILDDDVRKELTILP